MTVTMGKRGTVVIPKALREECELEEGTKIDVSLENKTLVLSPSVQTRTRMDENFDQAAAILAAKGVTLEMALARLTEIKARGDQPEDTKAHGRSRAA